MNRIRTLFWLLAALLSLLGTTHAQTLTVNLSNAAVNWNNLVPGSASNPASGSVNVTTSWTGMSPKGGGINLTVYAYFAAPSAALAHQGACTTGCPDIPSSAFEIKVNTNPYVSATGTSPFSAGGSVTIASIPITGANKDNPAGQVDTLLFNINLSALPSLPADTYKGVLTIVAQSSP